MEPAQAFLTHMNHEVDYTDWSARLPPDVLPAHDGLVIELWGGGPRITTGKITHPPLG